MNLEQKNRAATTTHDVLTHHLNSFGERGPPDSECAVATPAAWRSLTPWNRILFTRPNFFLNRFKVDKTVVFYSAWDDTKNCGRRIGSPIDTKAIMTNQQLDMMRPENAGAVGDHWILYLIEGGLLVLLGVLAAFMPPWFGITLFGWLFLVGGFAGLITTFVMWHAPGFWWSLLSAVFTMGVGGFLFAQPELGIVTLFLVLITFLILEGIVTIMFALDHWRELSGRWGLMLASGIVDLTLASVILIGLPATSAWAMGVIVGINLVFGGAAMIGMALAARRRIGRANA
jgi:uncharacterized membrane protein HdeD (DUF308 family)